MQKHIIKLLDFKDIGFAHYFAPKFDFNSVHAEVAVNIRISGNSQPQTYLAMPSESKEAIHLHCDFDQSSGVIEDPTKDVITGHDMLYYYSRKAIDKMLDSEFRGNSVSSKHLPDFANDVQAGSNISASTNKTISASLPRAKIYQ